MTTQNERSTITSHTSSASSFKNDTQADSSQKGAFIPGSAGRQLFSWEYLTATIPLVHLVQPEYYMVYRYSAPGIPIYQQKLSLDLGDFEVTCQNLYDHILEEDLKHLKVLDKVINRFALECNLEPFDFICSVMIRWNDAAHGQRFLVRKSTVLQIDKKGIPVYGIMAFKDVTALVSSIKPNNVDVTFRPEKSDLCSELSKRMKAVQPQPVAITRREKEIVRCLSHGMSSKEIASALFISKATVDTHRQNLIHKWEVPNTAALLQKAMAVGCI